MPIPRLPILDNNAVKKALWRAWQDSHPGPNGGHEEGGFVLRDASGILSVERWRKGEQDTIILPAHENCRVGDSDIVASFHTHPSTGSNYVQEPSETDRRAVREDPNLKGTLYEGELVISQEKVYLIETNGQMSEVGNTRDILA
jgi:hypothetical protein